MAETGSGNTAVRVGSALVLAPLALGSAYFGGVAFAAFWLIAALTVLWEWTSMTAPPPNRVAFYLAASALILAAALTIITRPVAAILIVVLGALATSVFVQAQQRLWMTGGVFCAGGMLLAPVLLRADADLGFLAVIYLFAIVWTTDILGYFGGRLFGGAKLAPSISPGKTWSGAVCGLVGAMIVVAIGLRFMPNASVAGVVILALLLSVVAQAGDLFESAMKRRFGTKDASQLIPGHGGVMDRLDGFWAAAVVAALIGISRGGFEAPARGLLLW